MFISGAKTDRRAMILVAVVHLGEIQHPSLPDLREALTASTQPQS